MKMRSRVGHDIILSYLSILMSLFVCLLGFFVCGGCVFFTFEHWTFPSIIYGVCIYSSGDHTDSKYQPLFSGGEDLAFLLSFR